MVFTCSHVNRDEELLFTLTARACLHRWCKQIVLGESYLQSLMTRHLSSWLLVLHELKLHGTTVTEVHNGMSILGFLGFLGIKVPPK